MGDDDRPKKSWKEIDAQRDRSGNRSRRDPGEKARDKASKSAAYSKYKSSLDKLFTPGGGAELPESLKAKLGPTSPEAQARKEATEALRSTPNAQTLRAYLDAGHELPDDARLLMGLLDVPDEGLIRPVLEALLAIVEEGKKPNRMLLIQRLEAVKTRAEEKPTLELVAQIRAALD